MCLSPGIILDIPALFTPGPYLSWRFSYLFVGTFFGIISATLGSPWMTQSDYQEFLTRGWDQR
jgi:hypothetical protein